MPSLRPIAGLVALADLIGSVAARDSPTRPLTMVIPGAAGSQPDQVGRYFAPYPSERLGDQVIVENVSGGGGTIGANRVAKAGSDGHQFVLGNAGTHAMTQVLHNLHLGGRHAEFC